MNKLVNMNTEVILLMISVSFSIGAFIGVVKISWMQDDIDTRIKELKSKLLRITNKFLKSMELSLNKGFKTKDNEYRKRFKLLESKRRRGL